jgi:plasmid maintenance system antidote protein VapI
MNITEDINNFLRLSGWSIHRLAKASGVDPGNLNRVVHGKQGLNSKSVERLWPYLYGDKRPSAIQKKA